MSYLLASLDDTSFLDEVSRGLNLVARNVRSMEEAAERLDETSSGRGRTILRAIGAEEAAKHLILLDAVRCPRNRQKERTQQLKRFNQHLAKGIYVEIAEIRPADYREVLSFIRQLREAYFLDGPNDVDWIFRNSIEADREQALYVDYMRTDDGAEWFDPTYLDDISSRPPLVIQLVLSMHRSGFGSRSAVSIVAEEWRDFTFDPSTRIASLIELNETTLERIVRETGADSSAQDHDLIWDIWPFPLWEADLSKTEVDLGDLRRKQSEWTPS